MNKKWVDPRDEWGFGKPFIEPVKPPKCKVVYEDDIQYNAITDSAVVYRLPKCSNCNACPTYDEKFCPFCGVELDYGEGE